MNESGNPMESDPSVDYLSGLQIMRLTRNHDRAAFDCGIDSLNKFLKEVARENATRGLSITYVATYDQRTIVGYYTLIPNYPINADRIPGQDSTSTIPAILFGKLAVATEHQGRKIGRFLLFSAMYDSQVIADRDGAEV